MQSNSAAQSAARQPVQSTPCPYCEPEGCRVCLDRRIVSLADLDAIEAAWDLLEWLDHTERPVLPIMPVDAAFASTDWLCVAWYAT